MTKKQKLIEKLEKRTKFMESRWFKTIWLILALWLIWYLLFLWEINYHIDDFNDKYLELWDCTYQPLIKCNYELIEGFPDEYLSMNQTEAFLDYESKQLPTFRKNVRDFYMIFAILFFAVRIYGIWK